MTPWEDALPAELRNIILEYVRDSVHLHPVYVGIPSPRHSHLARLSSVNRQWRDFFSPNIDIVVNQFRLEAFNRDFQTEEQRARVRRIRFHVKLPTYVCAGNRCMLQESHGTKTHHDLVFAIALRQFMQIMSSWRMDGRGHRGIQLDIGAYSPSDAHHYFLTNEMNANPIPEGSPRIDDHCPVLPHHMRFLHNLGVHPEQYLPPRLYAWVGDPIWAEVGLEFQPVMFFHLGGLSAPIFDSLTIRSQ